MDDFYFTFGFDHYQVNGGHKDAGMRMKDYWIKVTAESYGKARDIFINRFSSIYMNKPTEWSFQYEKENFKPEYFPKGEYLHLKQ